MGKKIVISAGPIPARLDSVKFITNRFKGGLAFRTAEYLADTQHDPNDPNRITVVTWRHTEVPENITRNPNVDAIVRVQDVYEYFDWFVANARNFDAFVMAAAVANLTPVAPYSGKFPSHQYSPGDEFNIKFMIAPRAIDAIKQINPRACLIGYKLFDTPDDGELIQIARHTLADAKANLIFANRPADAKDRKLAVTADGSVIPCAFNQHLALMLRAIEQEYYHTDVTPLTDVESSDPDIREALATAGMFEKTFPGHGTVAVPVRNHAGMFATTSRGHRSNPVLIRKVDFDTRTVYASARATLNAPALAAMLSKDGGHIVVHRHEDDPHYRKPEHAPTTLTIGRYVFPGTVEETDAVRDAAKTGQYGAINELYHGYIRKMPILDIDWDRYHELFPNKYFTIPDRLTDIIRKYDGTDTIEIGANRFSDARYAYDPYVRAGNAVNLTWNELTLRHFTLAYAKNALNYMTLDEIQTVLAHADAFAANTFLTAPESKIADQEAAVTDVSDKIVRHTLRLPDDSVMRHEFHAYTREDYEALGLTVTPYGRNSALVTKGVS